MPGYKGHLAGGLGSYALVLLLLSNSYGHIVPIKAMQWLVFALAGSLFPDVDIKSKGQNIFYLFIACCILFLILLGRLQAVALLSIASLIPMLVCHRGMFHRLWFVIGLPFTLAFLAKTYLPLCSTTIFLDALFFVIGAISHLWLDFGLKRMTRL